MIAAAVGHGRVADDNAATAVPPDPKLCLPLTGGSAGSCAQELAHAQSGAATMSRPSQSPAAITVQLQEGVTVQRLPWQPGAGPLPAEGLAAAVSAGASGEAVAAGSASAAPAPKEQQADMHTAVSTQAPAGQVPATGSTARVAAPQELTAAASVQLQSVQTAAVACVSAATPQAPQQGQQGQRAAAHVPAPAAQHHDKHRLRGERHASASASCGSSAAAPKAPAAAGLTERATGTHTQPQAATGAAARVAAAPKAVPLKPAQQPASRSTARKQQQQQAHTAGGLQAPRAPTLQLLKGGTWLDAAAAAEASAAVAASSALVSTHEHTREAAVTAADAAATANSRVCGSLAGIASNLSALQQQVQQHTVAIALADSLPPNKPGWQPLPPGLQQQPPQQQGCVGQLAALQDLLHLEQRSPSPAWRPVGVAAAAAAAAAAGASHNPKLAVGQPQGSGSSIGTRSGVQSSWPTQSASGAAGAADARGGGRSPAKQAAGVVQAALSGYQERLVQLTSGLRAAARPQAQQPTLSRSFAPRQACSSYTNPSSALATAPAAVAPAAATAVLNRRRMLDGLGQGLKGCNSRRWRLSVS
jgi:hypothetical protein